MFLKLEVHSVHTLGCNAGGGGGQRPPWAGGNGLIPSELQSSFLKFENFHSVMEITFVSKHCCALEKPPSLFIFGLG